MIDQASQSQIKYIQNALEYHIKNHFHTESFLEYQKAEIKYIPYDKISECSNLKPGTIVIPVIKGLLSNYSDSWEVNFRNTKIILWDFINPPNNSWKLDNINQPLWYVNSNNIYMPAWNMFGVLLELISANEELLQKKNDKHGRFLGSMSSRHEQNLLEVPIFNNAAALLVDKCLILGLPNSSKNILFSKPVRICLSHDLDQLRGDDFWTQFSRIARLLTPIMKLRQPEFSQIKFIFQNIRNPRKFFMDDLLKMINLEKKFGYKSISYVLCGKRGRYGARTSLKYIKKYLSEIPPGFEIGMHYNYDTHLDKKSFLQQKDQIENIIGCDISSGRAHYLQMDFNKSYKFWEEMGIEYDESFGYSDKVGYRAGIAGPFLPYDIHSENSLNIISIPLIAMDSCIVNNFGKSSLIEIEKHIAHLNEVGGTFTLLFHPGRHENEEYKETKGMYQLILEIFKKYDAECVLPSELSKN